MKVKRTILFLCLILSGLCVQSQAYADLSALLPLQAELGEWALAEAPRQAQGDDLFALINGGAELYLELGFKQALMASYTNKAGTFITLEIYEMSDPKAARTVFEQKAGGQGKRIALGDGALLADYYLNFWKGPYQVTLTGDDSTRETVEGLMTIAKLVEENI